MNASIANYTGASYIWDRATFAAKICNSYSVIKDGVNYSGWYLPSIEELKLLYAEKNRLGTTLTGFSSYNYWSSTEHGTYSWAYAQTLNFADGIVTLATGKQTNCRVRAIRAF
jgi:hypothetical protein